MKIPTEQTLYIRSMGKALKVTAIFLDDDSANAYMAKNKDEGVVSVIGQFIFLANVYDHGTIISK